MHFCVYMVLGMQNITIFTCVQQRLRQTEVNKNEHPKTFFSLLFDTFCMYIFIDLLTFGKFSIANNASNPVGSESLAVPVVQRV